MGQRALRFRVGGVLLLGLLASCTPIRSPRGKSPLVAPQMSPQAVALDVFTVRFPFGDPRINGDLWAEIDEQCLPPGLRGRLAENGFRVGLVGGQIPVILSELLKLKDKPAPSGKPQTADLAELADEEGPLRSHKQLRAGTRTDLVVSQVYDELPLLLCGPEGVHGRSYPQAQGILAVRTKLLPDGRVGIKLTPEVHYGQQQQQFRGEQGVWRMELSKPRRAFEKMTISAELTAGHMLVLSSLPGRPGSLGHYFFTTSTSGSLEQKLMVIRISQTQHDPLFEPEPLPLGEKP